MSDFQIAIICVTIFAVVFIIVAYKIINNKNKKQL